jgi:co-chaperonin GroES (HSP10)
MKTPYHVWVEYPKMFEDTIETKTGLILSKVNDYKPEWHAILHGMVFTPPTKTKIKQEILPGDKIYFHYLAADEEEIMTHPDNGRKMLRVPESSIFCIVREGKIIPYGGHVFAKPMYSDDIQEVEVGGKKIMARVSASGLVTSTQVSFIKNSTVVKYIGESLDGEDLGVRPGDTVVMEVNSHKEYEIEGEKYHVFEQSDILCIISS